jgi:16S rRNA (cytosine1402-N4)-methyltransferase
MKHIPVLLQEVLEGLAITPSGIYVDATLGGASHAYEIAAKLTTGHLYGFDQDPYSITVATQKLSDYTNVTIINSNFRHLATQLHQRRVTEVDGILMDIGVSSFQLDDPERGFSYHHDAPLDMRMDTTQQMMASDIINTYSAQQLKDLFTTGEVPFTNRLVDRIIEVRKASAITTTFELVEIIQQVAPRIEKKKRHPARLVFQALRLEVNQELQVLEEAISQALALLAPSGRLAIITFHSLEDRMVKQAFHHASTVNNPLGVPIRDVELQAKFKLITKKPITASEEERKMNPRSSSAKLRVIERL